MNISLPFLKDLVTLNNQVKKEDAKANGFSDLTCVFTAQGFYSFSPIELMINIFMWLSVQPDISIVSAPVLRNITKVCFFA